jgi:hypothetical protein
MMSSTTHRTLRVAFCLFSFSSTMCAYAEQDSSVQAKRSLCSSLETVVFSCEVKNQRIVSVCASQTLSATTGYVQYRFGKPSKIEVAVPKTATDSVAITTAWRDDVRYRTVMYAGGGGVYLRFNQAPYSYIAYSAMGRGWIRKAGVTVIKGDKTIVTNKCVGKLTGEGGPAFFEKAGIVEEHDEVMLPSP